LLEFPTAEEQASKTWLGGGAEGGAVRALAASAQFLKDQKQIDAVLPDYTSYVTDEYAKAAAK
jgi:taurine transport system substrate-binding protein